MGALGRFIQRKDKARVSLKQPPAAVSPAKKTVYKKRKLASKARNFAKRAQTKLTKSRNESENNPNITMGNQISSGQDNDNNTHAASSSDLFDISSTVAARVKIKVQELLATSDGGRCSVVTMAYDLQADDQLLSMYANEVTSRNLLRRLANNMMSTWRGRQMDDLKGRYGWTKAMNRLETLPSSRDTKVSSWEEAKESLKQVLRFVDEGDEMEVDGLPQLQDDGIAVKFSKKMDTDMDQVKDDLLNMNLKGAVKWQQVESFVDVNMDPEAAAQQTMRDLNFNARIKNQEELVKTYSQTEAAMALVEREKLREAEERARSLMRPFTEEEHERIRRAMFGHGPEDEIIAQDGNGADNVVRRSMQTLQPGQWLNDEVIHYFYLMLANRDAEMCKMDPSKKRSHFFKSFFMTKLLNEGNATRDGEYEYRNVKRWSKKVPGKDIFALDKIIFPINMGQMHWICAAIFMAKKKIQIFDSMGSSGDMYLQALFQYLQDEHMDKKKKPLPDLDQWEFIPTTPDTPRQRNGEYCTVPVSFLSQLVF